MEETITRCTKCVLPDTTPGISFDNQGVCTYCHSYKSKTVMGESALLEILNEYRNKCKNKEFDCMIGVGGGRDSTFLMWKLAHEYKMRVLAVHYDNPFSSEQATRNLESAAK
jgi:glycerol dehydrogenase-like iron-containing ADH family enzyme